MQPHFGFLGVDPSLLLCIGTGFNPEAVTSLVTCTDLTGELPQTRHCGLGSGWVRLVAMSAGCVLGTSISVAQEPPAEA